MFTILVVPNFLVDNPDMFEAHDKFKIKGFIT